MPRTLAVILLSMVSCLTFADDPKGPPGDDLKQLQGTWVSPPLQLAEDLKARAEMIFEFKDPGKPSGQARLNFVPLDKLAPAITVGLLGAEVRGREIVLAGRDPKGTPEVQATLAYELKGDRLKLTSARPFRHPTLPGPVDLSGEWQRAKPEKK